MRRTRGGRRRDRGDLCDFRPSEPWRTCTPSTRVPINATGTCHPAFSGTGCGWTARRPRDCIPGSPRAGRPSLDKGEDLDVTTMSSAEPTRRDFLYIATASVGAVGAAAAAWPLIAQMNPDASTIAAGAPVEVDLRPTAER